MSFKVLQFNMQYAQPWDDAYPDTAPLKIEATIDEVRSHNADIIMLQEVERARPGGEQTNPPPHYSRLKKEFPEYDSYFCYPKADPRELPFGIGLAIFSKTPLTELACLNLPSPPVEFDFFGEKKTPTDRLLIGATTVIGNRKLRLFNTHLLAFFMLKSSSEVHLDQRKLVEEQLRRSGDIPTLLTGDFNVSKHESLIHQFADAGYRTVQSTEITWRRRPYVLDHIFYNRWLKPVGWEVKPTMSSDHHTLVATLDFVG
jgi:endonuclease/exonuclease/phosphatase family metal-dependent hydrolase